MSPRSTPLRVTQTVSNTKQLAHVAGLHEHNLERDAHLQIYQFKGMVNFWLSPLGKLFDTAKTWACDIPFGDADLFGHVEACLQVWDQVVVKRLEVGRDAIGGSVNLFPFQEQWDLSQRPDLLDAVGPPLAQAGNQLFFDLFENRQDPRELRFAACLRQASQNRPLILLITSNEFFVPWGLLYVHPVANETLKEDGSNFKWEGFWGYRHIIEHNTQDIDLENTLKPDATGKVFASINIDEGIDKGLKVQCIAPQLSFFNGHTRLKVVERRQKAELQKALTGKDFADRILYFCCHGVGSPDQLNPEPNLTLTDGDAITARELRRWLHGRDLATNPIVFINACQGGKMKTLFYKTLAAEFLKLKAAAVLGSQIDMPAVFAAAFAQRFFDRFLSGNGTYVRIGPLLRSLTQEFVTKSKNPLGLVYSLYRGADCYVDWSNPFGE